MSDFSVSAKVTSTPPARVDDMRARILAAARARLEQEARERSAQAPFVTADPKR